MYVVFLSVSAIKNLSEQSITLDLLREFQAKGHQVYIVCACDEAHKETSLKNEGGIYALRVKIGKNKKASLLRKGLTTLLLPFQYKSAIKKYLSDVRFDLVLYSTPPVTHAETVNFLKKRDAAKSYLLLKDIFPQNAVDIGVLSKNGLKGIIYKYFRAKEKKLYALSDCIGCMSQANVDYLLKHNPKISPDRVEVCPNAIEVQNLSVTPEEQYELREKYGIPQDKEVFVYGGNLGKPQGIPFLIDCLKSQINNPHVYFIIVGDGTEYDKLEAFFNKTQPSNMKLMKRLPKEDYDRMVAACDVGMIFLDHNFTIPNFPSRLLGYMQAGLPVLACTDPNTDIGKVIVEGGFGWWCESDNIEKFGEIVREICNTQTDNLGERSFLYLNENYTVAKAFKTINNHL